MLTRIIFFSPSIIEIQKLSKQKLMKIFFIFILLHHQPLHLCRNWQCRWTILKKILSQRYRNYHFVSSSPYGCIAFGVCDPLKTTPFKLLRSDTGASCKAVEQTFVKQLQYVLRPHHYFDHNDKLAYQI